MRTKLEHFRHNLLTVRAQEGGVLTQRQLQLLRFIQDYVRDRDVSPSFEEMRAR